MQSQKSKATLFRGTSIVASFTLLSRLLGFVRDLLFARLFGSSALADTFFVAFRIPNLLRSFVAEGALTSAFVPVFARELAKSEHDARETLRSTTSLLLLLTLFLSLIGNIYSEELVALFAPGFGRGSAQTLLCSELLQIMMFYIMFVSLVAMLNGALNSVGIFGVAALAQVVMNGAMIAGVVFASFFSDAEGLRLIAYSVLLGGLLQVAVQIPALRRSGLMVPPSVRILSGATLSILKLMLPAILGAAVYQLGMYINTVLASLLQPGSVSWLFYADRISQLPIGVFSVALSSVLLPMLSQAAARDDQQGFSSPLLASLRYTSFLIIPCSVALCFYASSLISLLFERGAFDSYSTEMTALALQAACLGLWAFSCHSLLIRAFLSRHDTRTPMLIGLISLICTVCLAIIFMGPVSISSRDWLVVTVLELQRNLTSFSGGFSFGHAGLALASACGAQVSLVLAVLLLARREQNLEWWPFFMTTLRSVIACGGMLAGFLVIDFFQFSVTLTLLVALFVGTIIYLVLCGILGSKEIHEIKSLITRKFLS